MFLITQEKQHWQHLSYNKLIFVLQTVYSQYTPFEAEHYFSYSYFHSLQSSSKGFILLYMYFLVLIGRQEMFIYFFFYQIHLCRNNIWKYSFVPLCHQQSFHVDRHTVHNTSLFIPSVFLSIQICQRHLICTGLK